MRVLKNWVNSYKEFNIKNEVPDVFHLWTSLWALSAAIGRKAWVDFGYFKLFPNIYTVLTGPPASHKSTAIKIAEKMVQELEGIHLGPNMTTKEALIMKLAESGEGFDYNNETTRHCSIAVTSPEWSNLMGAKDMEFCNTLCELYDCDDKFDKWTKTQGSDKIKNVFLAMIGGSTIKQVSECLPAASIGGGLTSRIVFVVGDEAKHKRIARPRLTKRDELTRIHLIEDLKDISSKVVGEFKFTSGGGEYYDKWYKDREEALKVDEKFIHYCDRKPTHVVKLSILLSASKGNHMTIGAGEVDEAIRMLEDIEPRMPEALGGVGLSVSAPIISSVFRIVREHKKITLKGIQTILWRDANRQELEMALLTILDMEDSPIERDDRGYFIWNEVKSVMKSKTLFSTSTEDKRDGVR